MSIPGESARSAVTPTEAEIRAFVVRNPAYYLQKWQPLLTGQEAGASFNVAAFCFGVLWVGYRRMWGIAWLIYGVILTYALGELVLHTLVLHRQAPRVWGTLVGIGIGLVCGINGNQWYFTRTSRAIARVREEGLPDETAQRLLAQRGGAHLVSSFLLALLFLTAVFVLAIALELAFEQA